MLDRADCAYFGCHNSIRLETKHFLNTLALTFISFSGRFVFAMQKHYLFFCERSSSSDCLRVAQHALVLGSSGNVQSNPTVSAQHTKLSVSAIQPGPPQEPAKSEPTRLAPRASAIKEQGFSEAVAARIEAPQRGSTRSVYVAKWTIFTKWCLSKIRWTSGHHLWKLLLTSSCTCFRTRSCNQALLMATDQPLLTNWAIPPLMSARMRISLVSWTDSIETDPRAGGASPPGTFPWCFTSWQRLPFNPLKRPPWNIWLSRLFSCWA